MAHSRNTKKSQVLVLVESGTMNQSSSERFMTQSRMRETCRSITLVGAAFLTLTAAHAQEGWQQPVGDPFAPETSYQEQPYQPTQPAPVIAPQNPMPARRQVVHPSRPRAVPGSTYTANQRTVASPVNPANRSGGVIPTLRQKLEQQWQRQQQVRSNQNRISQTRQVNQASVNQSQMANEISIANSQKSIALNKCRQAQAAAGRAAHGRSRNERINAARQSRSHANAARAAANRAMAAARMGPQQAQAAAAAANAAAFRAASAASRAESAATISVGF